MAPKQLGALLGEAVIETESTRTTVPGGFAGDLDAQTSDDRVEGDVHGRSSVAPGATCRGSRAPAR